MHTSAVAILHCLLLAVVFWVSHAPVAAQATPTAPSTTPSIAPPAAPPADLITERGFFRDPTGQLGLAQVQGRDFKLYRGPLPLGNTDAVTWLRLRLAPSQAGDWVLLLQPALLQDVQVHEPLPDGQWRVQRLGNQFAHALRPLKSLTFSMPVQADPQQPRTLYVRVKTPSSLVHARVVPEAEVRELDGRMHGLVGVYGGIGLTMLLLSVAGWVVTRQRLWLHSALVDLFTLALTALQLGFVAKYLLPDADGLVHHMVIVANCCHLAVMSLFFRHLYRQLQAPRWVLMPYLLVALMLPVLLWLQVQGKAANALALNNLMILGLSLWGLVAVWFLRPDDRLTRLLVRTLVLVLTLYLLFWVSPLVLRVSPPTALSLYPTLPSNLFTMVMVVLLLARDTQLRTRTARDMANEKLIADQQLLSERRMHEQTAGFLGMLVHEVRNPLALIQVVARNIATGRTPPGAPLAQSVARIDSAVSDINGVLERCVETDQLERGALAPQPSTVDAAAALRDWLALHREQGRIQATLPDHLPAMLDTTLWLAMVRNLVENALKYAPAGAQVQLQLQASAALLQVEVRNPPGPAGRPDPARLFQKFYRSDTAAGISGTGLGLYWVQQLSTRLGGGVQCLQPSAHDGSAAPVVFRLSLPLGTASA